MGRLYVPDSLVCPKEIKGTHYKLTRIELDCGHTLDFKSCTPSKGDHAWCFNCDDVKVRVA